MSKSFWLMSAGALAIATPAWAQDTTSPTTTTSAAEAGAVDTQPVDDDDEEIVVTAQGRAQALQDVPLAVSAISGESLQNSGVTDIRQLNQLSPSLYVSSTSSEAGAGGAGIRGIRTVGDNAGLESSVATFIDGVYRSRSGIGLTELGPLERIEILRGPQGTLFGRNASAGLISIVTARPRFENEGYAEASYGNYDYMRLGAGFTGPLSETAAFRLDGIWMKRDGFLKDVISGRRINNRDRYLVRGKLLFEPSDGLSVLLIGDYTNREEECCGATYQPANDVFRNADGTLRFEPSSIANLERSLTSLVPGSGRGIINDDTFLRQVSITPGRSFRNDVQDWGVSAEVNYDLGGASVTSITSYRDYELVRGIDGDFNNLDILARDDDGTSFQTFETFTQEVRFTGSAFEDRIDWLVGGYFAHETLTVADNIEYGVDYNQFAAGRVALLSPALAAFPLFGFQGLNAFTLAFANGQLATNPAFAGVPAGARPAIAAAIAARVQNAPISGGGIDDLYEQKSRNWALFTHNIFDITDRVSLTLGARYTSERKTLDADLNSNTICPSYVNSINALRALAAAASIPGGPTVVPGLPSALNGAVAGLAGALAAPGTGIFSAGVPLVCVINGVNGDFTSVKKESEWSGTAVLSFKPVDELLTYVSYSRGYKAGGFNLDRAPLFSPVTLASSTNLDLLKFDPEKVNAFELGAKYDGRGFGINLAAFYQKFKSFQLNTFNGTNFVVTDIRGCKDDLGTTDEDITAGNSPCANTRSGVTSKGVEIEATVNPHPDVRLAAGLTVADTSYYKDLSGSSDFYQPANGNSLIPTLFLLPGSRLSHSSHYVATGSATFTPPIGSNLRGLFYADFRYQSKFNTGSDLFTEKEQREVTIVNARAGIGSADRNWSLELWAQNLFNADYKQVAFNAPIQGSNTSRAQTQQFGTTATQLFGAFLAEPRTYGITGRFRF